MGGILPDASTVLKWGASTVLLSLTAAGGLLYHFQSSIIYPSSLPEGSRINVPTPEAHGLPYEDVTLLTPDAVKIKAYLLLQQSNPSSRPTVVLLHANAGNVGHRLPIANVFVRKMGCNVLALSYRGYGLSEGTASEKGFRLDAQTALDFVLSHPQLEKTQIFLYGQSIGGAVAIDLASRNLARVHGLIIENTFLSLPKLVPHVLPFLTPFVFLLNQYWTSEALVPSLTGIPVLFLSGKRDELVPPAHMKRLFEACGSEGKEWREFEEGTHNDTCMQPHYFITIATFIAAHTTTSTVLEALEEEKKGPASVASSTTSFEMVEKQEEEGWGSAAEAGSVVELEEVLKEKL